MNIKRKQVIIPICILLIIGLVGGGIFAAVQVQNSKKVVEVVPVTNVSTYNYDGYSSSYGRVTSDVSQTIYLESDATVKDIFVQAGDTVTVGTPLIQYDTELIELDIETKKLDIQTIEMNIDQANKDIQSLKKGVVPSGGISIDNPVTTPDADVEDNNTNITSAAPKVIATSAQVSSETVPTSESQAPKTAQTPESSQTPDTTQPPETSQTPETTPPPPESQTPDTPGESEIPPESESESTGESESQSESESESVGESESESEADVFEEVLDKDFDFTKYENTVNEEGAMIIPCSLTTKITPEFINLIRGKNADGSDMEEIPDPENPGQTMPVPPKKLLLTFSDGTPAVLLDGSKFSEPFINTQKECTLQQFIEKEGQMPVDELALLDKTFFETYPQALSAGRTILISAASQTQITPEFIYILLGRNADGSENENGTPLSAAIWLSDIEKTCTLDPASLPLPYVTSVATTLADFMANELELTQEPIKELDKDTPLDVSHDHRDVYEIYCDESTVITKDFINHIRENKMTVILKIEGHASWITLDGSKMEAPSENAIDTPIADFIANGIALNEKPEEGSDISGGDWGDGNWGGGIDIGGGPSYTAEEIKDMLTAKQLELSRLETQKRQAKLDLAKLQNQLNNATVTSIVNGVVTDMQTLDENTNTSEPFMTINSTEGLYLTGTINELDLGTLTVGQTISAMSWNTGSSFDATIKEVSPYPTANADTYGKNPNSSNYPFIALIDNPPEGLMENENVEITTGNNSGYTDPAMTGENIYLSKAYILTEDNGQSCVYVAGSDGRLERRTVVTGKVLGGYMEITNDAVTAEDYVAFPYGKDVREGVKTKINEEVYY